MEEQKEITITDIRLRRTALRTPYPVEVKAKAPQHLCCLSLPALYETLGKGLLVEGVQYRRYHVYKLSKPITVPLLEEDLKVKVVVKQSTGITISTFKITDLASGSSGTCPSTDRLGQLDYWVRSCGAGAPEEAPATPSLQEDRQECLQELPRNKEETSSQDLQDRRYQVRPGGASAPVEAPANLSLQEGGQDGLKELPKDQEEARGQYLQDSLVERVKQEAEKARRPRQKQQRKGRWSVPLWLTVLVYCGLVWAGRLLCVHILASGGSFFLPHGDHVTGLMEHREGRTAATKRLCELLQS